MSGISLKLPRNGALTALTTIVVALGGTAGYNWKYGGDGVAQAQALEKRVQVVEHEIVRREESVKKIAEIGERTTRLEEQLKSAEVQRRESQARNDAAHKEQSEWLRKIMEELRTQDR